MILPPLTSASDLKGPWRVRLYSGCPRTWSGSRLRSWPGSTAYLGWSPSPSQADHVHSRYSTPAWTGQQKNVNQN